MAKGQEPKAHLRHVQFYSLSSVNLTGLRPKTTEVKWFKVTCLEKKELNPVPSALSPVGKLECLARKTVACVHKLGSLLWYHLLACSQPQPELSKSCGQHISLTVQPDLQLAHPSRAPSSAQLLFLSQPRSSPSIQQSCQLVYEPCERRQGCHGSSRRQLGRGATWYRAPDLPGGGEAVAPGLVRALAGHFIKPAPTPIGPLPTPLVL